MKAYWAEDQSQTGRSVMHHFAMKALRIGLLVLVLPAFALAADHQLTPSMTYSDYVRAQSTPQSGINFATGLQRSNIGSSITLAWDASPQTIGGYYLYYGFSSGSYDHKVDVGHQTTYTLANLRENQTYYFALTAYDLARTLESDFSNEVRTSLAEARNHSGIWFDPQKNGQAVTLLQEGTVVSGVWYLYAEDGQGMWVTFAGSIDGDRVESDLVRFTGPALGTGWDEALVAGFSVGSVTLTFNAADAIVFAYTLNGMNGTLNLAPFSFAKNASKKSLTPLVGAYSGVFSGDDVGVFLISIGAKGTLSGLAVSSADGVSFALTGKVDSAGGISMNGAGNAFVGTVSAASEMTGSWVNQQNHTRGDFNATKQP